MESLLDLEKLGFDVAVFRGRINEMLSIIDTQGQILNESKDAEGKILRCSREKTKMAEEMVNIEKQIAELQEKHALIKSEKESKEHEINILQVRVNEINEDIQSTRLGFEKLAAAPWKSV
jgi:chromosome segregation ATPase